MANRIIFLGAGASKADGAPLQAELFKAYVNSLSCSFNLDYHNRYLLKRSEQNSNRNELLLTA